MNSRLRILLVEDELPKAERVGAVLSQALAPEDYRLDVARTVAEAIRTLQDNIWDVLLLDLHVPAREGEGPRPDGGRVLLQELERPGRYKVPEHVIGLTRFKELAEEQGPTFRSEMIPIVEFDNSSEEWARRLTRKISGVVAARSRIDEMTFSTDLVIVTALHKVELESVLELPGDWREDPVGGDPSVYYRGTFGDGTRRLTVVATCLPEMGMPAAAAMTMKAIEIFRPRVVGMCGIAAGVEGEYGDVLVADRCWDYGSGKIVGGGGGRESAFLPTPSQIAIHPLMKTRLNCFLMDSDVFRRIRDGWKETAPATLPKARLGPIASGASVVSKRDVIDGIRKHHAKLVGVEMEAYGVLLAAQLTRWANPLTVIAKSICDFGDYLKDDRYQRYAAYTSARFLYEFAIHELAGEDFRVARKG